MAKVEVKEPDMVVIEFHQERSDDDYGSCIWARFVLDTKNYDLHITSDCGEYGYSGWIPTPDKESFLKLLSRMGSEYLLSKISDLSVINTEQTYEEIKKYIEAFNYKYESGKDLDIDMDSIYTACTYDSSGDIVAGVRSILSNTWLDNIINDYEIYNCICEDYPVQAKKIAEIFKTYIQPKIKEILMEE